MNPTNITWTERTWNPVTGCEKVSPGCKHCYATELHNKRNDSYLNGKLLEHGQYALPFSQVQFLPERLSEPLHHRKPRLIFLASMGDLMHEALTDAQINAVLDTCRAAHWHKFQILTKRPERLHCFDFPPNVWVGVTVEDRQHGLPRVDSLREIPAGGRFLSCEPLLEDLGPLELAGIDVVIAGCESGAKDKRRPCRIEWVRGLRDQCAAASVGFHLKQLYEGTRLVSLPELDGRQYRDMPEGSALWQRYCMAAGRGVHP